MWVARSVSFLGDSLGLVALLLYVEGATGAALAVALLLLAGDFTPGLFGAFAVAGVAGAGRPTEYYGAGVPGEFAECGAGVGQG